MGRPRYLSLFPIAEGGMGIVDLVVAAGETLGRPYARKRLLPALRVDPEFRAMFMDEARMASMLAHPNIVTVLDLGDDSDGPYLLMEYVQGVSAERLMAEASDRAVPLPLQIAVRICADAARGLHAAHEARDRSGQPLGMIHRDISPQNLLIAYNGAVKVADFGIARAFGRSTRTTTGVLKGNIGYLAPETLRFERADRRADLFALGVTLYELVAGRRLYPTSEDGARRILGEPPPDLIDARPEVPAELVELSLELLAKDREDRPADAAEVASRLEEILANFIAHEGTFPLAEYLQMHFASARAQDEERLESAREQLRRQESSRRWRRRALTAVPVVLLVAMGTVSAVRRFGGGSPLADDLLAAGSNHTCLRQGQDLHCWGKNNHGQLGYGLEEVWSVRQRVRLAGVIGLGLGATHTCACTADGRAHCWGRNDLGQLGGASTAETAAEPLLVPGVVDCRQIVAGQAHTCSRGVNGTVQCWGSNLDGQTGVSRSRQEPTPHRVPDLPDIISIAAGGSNTCAVARDATLWCWGDNIGLGDGSESPRATPKPVPALTAVVDVAMGPWNVCVRRRGGDVQCWGAGNALRLDGSTINKLRPVPVPALSGSRQLAIGGGFACGLRADGGVLCFGGNDVGQLGGSGDRRSALDPILVEGLGSVTRIVAGASHACARHDRGVSCWGSNETGQLGDGKATDSAHPVAVAGLAR